MNYYLTVIETFHNDRGQTVLFAGPVVIAVDQEDAEDYCRKRHPHVKVIGRFIRSIKAEA